MPFNFSKQNILQPHLNLHSTRISVKSIHTCTILTDPPKKSFNPPLTHINPIKPIKPFIHCQ